MCVIPEIGAFVFGKYFLHFTSHFFIFIVSICFCFLHQQKLHCPKKGKRTHLLVQEIPPGSLLYMAVAVTFQSSTEPAQAIQVLSSTF
jgi:hypothetical protein